MSIQKVLAGLAALLALLSFFVATTFPVLPIAVILIAVAILLLPGP